MNKKQYIWWIIAVVFLSWCWSQSTQNTTQSQQVQEKKDFYVKTQKIGNFWKEVLIKKTWRLVWSQDITISAQAVGKINTINIKEWQTVSQWDMLIMLSDSISSYEQNLKSAQNSVDTARLTYQNNKISLEKNIADSKLALDKANNDYLQALNDTKVSLDKAQKDYTITQKDVEENLKQAQTSVADSDLNSQDSQAKQNIEKLKSDISKANLDYDNLLKTNQQTIKWYKSSLKVYYSNINLLFDDIILLWDKLLWVTNQNKNFNDGFESYLWAKNTANKTLAESSLNNIIKLKDSFVVYDTENLTDDEIIQRLNSIENWFTNLDKFLDQLENVLKDTVESTALSNTDINTYISSINWYQSSVNTYYNQVNSFNNWIKSFLKIYKDQELSTKKSIESLNQQLSILETTLKSTSTNAQIWLSKTQLAWESGLLSAKTWLEKTQISANMTIKAYETALQNAKNTYDNLISTKDLTLSTLQNNIDQTNIQYQNASKEYEKLFIKSPISWKIAKVYVDKWQEVSIWTPLIQVVNSSQPEINVSFSANEIDYLQMHSKVQFEYNNNTYTWDVISIWNVADNNLNYTVKIWINENISKIWDFVSVMFPIKSNSLVLPLNSSYIEWNWKWYIFVLSWDNFQRIPISYGKAWFDKIEIVSELNPELEMITTDIKNYDQRKYKIVVKND